MNASFLGIVVSGFHLLIVAGGVCADSWEISQSLTSNTVNQQQLLQNGTTSNSLQAMNAANLGSASSVIGLQTVTMTNGNLLLDQRENTDSNKQAANLIVADAIGDGSNGSMRQVVDVGTQLTLSQYGTNNTQALNLAIASSNIEGLQQEVSIASGSVELNQRAGSSGGKQSANMAIADAIGDGNSGSVVQTVNADAILSSQDGTNNIQAINMVEANDVGGLNQIISSNNISQEIVVGATNNTQALNYIDTDGVTGDINQSVTAINHSAVNNGDNSNVIAGNLLARSAFGGFVGQVTQNFRGSSVTITGSTAASVGTGFAANYLKIN